MSIRKPGIAADDFVWNNSCAGESVQILALLFTELVASRDAQRLSNLKVVLPFNPIARRVDLRKILERHECVTSHQIPGSRAVIRDEAVGRMRHAQLLRPPACDRLGVASGKHVLCILGFGTQDIGWSRLKCGWVEAKTIEVHDPFQPPEIELQASVLRKLD